MRSLVRSTHVQTPGGRHYDVRVFAVTRDTWPSREWTNEVYCATAGGVTTAPGAVWALSPAVDLALARHERIVGYARAGAEELLVWLRENVDWQRKEGEG